MYGKGIYLLLLAVLTAGCSYFQPGNQEEPVARVYDRYLYPSDLADAIPEGSSQADSMTLAKRYIDTWVKDQLMVQQANEALSEDQKDFDKQIAEYHRSLLIYTYRQKLLQQKLDTAVSELELEAYYRENLSNFLLSRNVIKGTYVKVPLSAPRIPELRRWSRSNETEDLDQMEKYCLSYAEKYTDFNDTWIYFSSIRSQFPMTISRPSAFLSYNRNLETTDSLFRYFLHVSDHLPEGEPAPLSMVRDDIASILLNKRKVTFFQDLEQRVYNDGVNRNQFEIYE
jgi:hypothetical protein